MSKKQVMPDAEDLALARIQERLSDVGSVNQTGDDWTCPCHDDKGASLTVRVGDVPGRVVMACGAGCNRKAILKKLGLKEADLFADSVPAKPVRKSYVYQDEDGRRLFRVARVETVGADGRRKKVFYQAGAKPGGGWRKVKRDDVGRIVGRPMDGVRLVLWRLPMLAKAIKDGEEIHLAEGEKDVEALALAGVPATCHPMGAGKWQDDYCQSLAGAPSVVVWADRDAAGYRCAAQRLSSLLRAGLPATARLPIPDHKGADVADHLAAGHSPADGKPVTLEELEVLATGSSLGSWAPEDLTEILSGTFQPPLPVVGRREDGLALFYPGKRHLLIAESEAGKTWLALYAAKQEMEGGHHVFFYDFEDDASGVVGRLLDMECTRAAIEQFFHYVRPDEPVTEELLEAVIARHRALRPTLVITDGVTEVMSQNGWGQSENNDIADFYNTILKPMASEGAAVVALDHLPKYDEKGRGAIGGVHKLNGIDGAAYRLEADREIAPGRVGRTRIKHDKDRPGQVKRHAEPKKRIADLIVDAEGEGPVLVMLFRPDAYPLEGESTNPEPAPKRATDSEARVLACFEDAEWRSTSAVFQRARADFGDKAPSATTVKRILGVLVEGGVLERRQERDGNNRKVDMWRQP